MKWMKIKATDAWFFRDGRPFNAGEESWANSLFPPFPSVPYGVLRSVYFGDNIHEFPKANEANDPSLQLRLRQFLFDLSDHGTSLTIPADLVRKKASADQPALPPEYLRPVAKPKPVDGFISNYPDQCTHLLMSPFPGKTDDMFGRAVISYASFIAYLKGSKIKEIAELKDYLISEPKVGLARDPHTRHAAEGMLYRVRYRRPEGPAELHGFDFDNRKQLCFLVAAELKGLPKTGLTKFGADGKLANITEGSQIKFAELPKVNSKDIFKMYLATASVFNEGWAPLSLFDDYGLTLCTAAMGKNQPVGGFDMKAIRPKPMRKAVPAGSVYYLQEKPEGGRAADFIEKFNGKALSGSKYIPDNLDHQGFGVAYFGNIQKT